MLKSIVVLCCVQLCLSRRFDNPLLNDPVVEPGVVKHSGLYYAAGSTQVGLSVAPIYESSDLQNWELKGEAFTSQNFPLWASNTSGIFSPELVVLGDNNFRIYFRAASKSSHLLSLGVAVSSNILGPYYSIDRPLLETDKDIAFPSVLNANGALYLFWSGWNDGQIYGQKLAPGGLSFAGGSPKVLVSPGLKWEGSHLEAPFAVVTDEYYYLFYSHYHSDCNGLGNGTGVARSKFANGPYEKYGDPILLPNSRLLTPEQPSVVKDLDGESDVVVFQAFKEGCDGPYLSAASLAWNNASWPHIVNYSFSE